MTDSVFPVTDDVMDRDSLRAWVAGISNAGDYVQSGFAVTAGTGLTINIGSGVAFGGGARMARDVATNGVAVTASVTNHVWVTLDETNLDLVVFVVNTTGTAPTTPNVKLATVTCDASGVTGVTDVRDMGPPVGGAIVRKNNGGTEYKRRRTDFVEGLGMAITVSDDASGNEVDVTFTWNGTAVKLGGTTTGTRRAINFIAGTGIAITTADDAAGDKVDVTVTLNRWRNP